jgi:hypothetical protein
LVQILNFCCFDFSTTMVIFGDGSVEVAGRNFVFSFFNCRQCKFQIKHDLRGFLELKVAR